MLIFIFRSFLCVCLLLWCSVFAQGQNLQSSGKEFWFGYMQSLSQGINGTPEYAIQLFAIAGATDVTLEVPGRNYSFTFSLKANEIKKLTLPSFNFEPSGSGVISDLAIHIQTTLPIEVVAIHNRIFFSATTRLFPYKSLGLNHVIIAAEDAMDASPSALLVVATADNTEVNVCQSPCGTKGEFSFILNRGQTYQFQSIDDLTGTIVNGDKPIAVFSGARQAALRDGDDSHIYMAMPPTTFADTLYAIVPDLGVASRTYIILLASEDGTQIDVGANAVKLNQNESIEVAVSTPLMVRSNKPIFSAQYHVGSGIRGKDGPAMIINQPVSSMVNKSGFRTKKDVAFTILTHAITFITKEPSSVIMNSVVVDGFKPIPDSDLFYLSTSLQGGSYLLSSTSGVLGQVYGSTAAEYYSFSLGYNDTAKVFPPFYTYSESCNSWAIAPSVNNGNFGLVNTSTAFVGTKVDVISSDGRLVYRDLNIEELNTQFTLKLAAGLYYLRLNACGSIRKFIVVNQ